ncbi:MAG: hypothetical protein LBR06_03005 [Bacteroidales bacterium]|nr:hypothetical protein [Bacteroidales bacterium]
MDDKDISMVSDLPSAKHILVVCSGNMCRSPIAAALLREASRHEPEPVCGYAIASYGTGADTHGMGRAMYVSCRDVIARAVPSIIVLLQQ